MKNCIRLNTTIVLLIVFLGNLNAQDRSNEGMYLSMSLGPTSGKIEVVSSEEEDNLTIKGTGIALDMHLGGFISKNVALHGSMGVKSIIGPTVNTVKLDGKYIFDEVIFGGGITGYTNDNFFLTGNIGLGSFSLDDGNSSVRTDFGFSFQLKAGKEWWVSPIWRIGIVAEYGATNLKDQYENITDNWRSNCFSIRLCATMCRKRPFN
ncbi:MAG: hypothetical protein IT213_07435 [Cytophagales bacterium]|nr:hypothetical protein [Cytophagales bacterium]